MTKKSFQFILRPFQVKCIPVLQTRLSVLKEEKRLLELQLKAKSTKPPMRSIGSGSNAPYDAIPDNCRSFGVGDGDVYEDEELERQRQHERELHTEQMRHTYEREKEVRVHRSFIPYFIPDVLTPSPL